MHPASVHSPKDWMVGFWSNARSTSKAAYRFCGVLIGPRHVLTVKHDLRQHENLFARVMGAATTPYRVVDRLEHPDFDVALLTVAMAPGGDDFPTLAAEGIQPTRCDLVGVFEGAYYEKVVNLDRADPEHRHHLFSPEQPKGVSGGALLSSGQLWGMVARRYVSENIGCAIPLYLLRTWLRDRLAGLGVSEALLPAIASTRVPSRRSVSLSSWLESTQSAALKPHLQAAAAEVGTPASGSIRHGPAALTAIAALDTLAHHQSSNDRIAGIHYLGRALKRTRDELGDDDYGKRISPRVAELFAYVTSAAFDCECTVVDADAAADSRVRLSPFQDMGLTSILAAQLFDGRLRFVPDTGGRWRAQWVFDIQAPPHGEKAKDAFYREAYRRMVSTDSAAELSRQRESAPLSETELAVLRRRIKERVIVDEDLVVFVDCSARLALTPGHVLRAQEVATELDVNVMLQASTAERPVLRMSAEEFEDAMHNFIGRHIG